MKIQLNSIYDKLADRDIKFFISDNDETAKREFSQFIIEVRSRNPLINLEEFQLNSIMNLDYEEINTKKRVITSADKIWKNFEDSEKKKEGKV